MRTLIACAARGAMLAILLAGATRAFGADAPINVTVECKCTDAVGMELCAAVKKEIAATAGFRVIDTMRQFGLGVHISCTDAFAGINKDLTGRMSMASLAFTIYSHDLPGEVYEDSSVFRVGKDAIDEMAGRIADALEQIVKANVTFFEHERSAAAASAAAPAKSPAPSPAATPPAMHRMMPES